METARSPRRAPASAYVLAIVTGAIAAAGVGLLAATSDATGGWWLRFAVFGLVAAGPLLGLAWLMFVSRHTVEADRHAEDNIERRWFTESTSGAFLDVATVAGLLLAALAVTGLEVDVIDVLTGLVVLSIIDAAARFAVLRHRGV